MKKKNSVSDFTSERNAVLIAHFRKQLAIQSQISIKKALTDAAAEPAPRFWVSEHRAAVVIGRILNSGIDEEEILNEMFEEKREMYREILRRVRELRKENPERTISDMVAEVVNEPAPHSYLSWHRARGIVHAEKRRRRLERSLR